MKRQDLFMFALILILFCTMGCSADEVKDQVINIAQAEDEHILGVKNGSNSAYPGKTYGEAFEGFFGSPTWKYFVGTKEGADETENVEVVEFTGYCTYQGVEVKALIQFNLDPDNDTFQATYLSFNDVPQNTLTLYALLETVFTNDSGIEMEDMIEESLPEESENSLNELPEWDEEPDSYYGEDEKEIFPDSEVVTINDILNTKWAIDPYEDVSFQITGTEDCLEFLLFETGNPDNIYYTGYSKEITATEMSDLYITFAWGEEEIAVVWENREFIDYPTLEALNPAFEEYAGDYHYLGAADMQ